MKRALIISPHFPPINAPDHQRIRMMLPYFSKNGWEVEVLAVDPDWVRAPQDKSLSETIPDGIRVYRVRGIPPSWTQRLGFDNLAIRTYRALDRRGTELLASGRFNLIFFSTTQHGVLPLARKWKERFAVPFIIDIQDPIVNDFYRETGTPPPGGKWKYALARIRARRLEKKVMPQASHTVSVSPDYLRELAGRSEGFSRQPSTVLPFPYSQKDIECGQHRALPVWLPEPPYILSAGRGGKDLEFAIRAFYRALSRWESRSRPSVCFAGTCYGFGGGNEKPMERLATEYGLVRVKEIPERQSYLDIVAAQVTARINCVFGSIDPRYQASKLIPLLAIGRPVLAILHENSPAADFLERHAPDTLCAFHPKEGEEELAERIAARLARWRTESDQQCPLPKLAEFEADPQTHQLSRIFDDCIQ